MGTRLQFGPTSDGFQISIASKKNWGLLVFLPIWLAFWTVGGVMAIRWLVHPEPETPRLFIFVWLIGWSLGEALVTYKWLWTAFGRELVTIARGYLTLKKDILGFGRSKLFPVSAVSNARATGLFGSLEGWSGIAKIWGWVGGTVAFESGGKTQRFGIQLEEDEAQQVLAQLKSQLPPYR